VAVSGGCPGRIFTTEYCCPADSLEFHGGKDDFRTKTPWYSVYSVVNSYFLDRSGIANEREKLCLF